MTKTGSRTYKLRLSDRGVDLFLACHYRLARLVRDFIPYGTTLTVAVALLDGLGADDIAAELEAPLCEHLAGSHVRFVGCSNELADTMRRVAERLTTSDQFAHKPPIGKLYIVSLVSFETAEDKQLADIYHRVVAQRPDRGKDKLTESEIVTFVRA